MADLELEVEGAAELARDLGKAANNVERESDQADIDIADYVAQISRAAASGRGGSAAKGSGSIRSGAGTVSWGGGGAPWMNGAEFGALRWKQFPRWKGTIPADSFAGGSGYFIHPSIRAKRVQIEAIMEDAVDKAIDDAF